MKIGLGVGDAVTASIVGRISTVGVAVAGAAAVAIKVAVAVELTAGTGVEIGVIPMSVGSPLPGDVGRSGLPNSVPF
jgi:hypothetical protein